MTSLAINSGTKQKNHLSNKNAHPGGLQQTDRALQRGTTIVAKERDGCPQLVSCSWSLAKQLLKACGLLTC